MHVLKLIAFEINLTLLVSPNCGMAWKHVKPCEAGRKMQRLGLEGKEDDFHLSNILGKLIGRCFLLSHRNTHRKTERIVERKGGISTSKLLLISWKMF